MVYSSTIKDRKISIFGVDLRLILEIPRIFCDTDILKRWGNMNPIHQHIELDVPWPPPNRLEKICEQIGKDVHAKSRKIAVPFSGLLYHYFFNLSKEYRACSYPGADIFLEREELKNNRIHKGYVKGREGFISIKMFEPNAVFEKVLPVPAMDVTENQARSYWGALIEIEGHGKYYGIMEVFICPGGQIFHGSNITPFDKPTKLSDDSPTHIIFHGSGELSELKDRIIERYRILSRGH